MLLEDIAPEFNVEEIRERRNRSTTFRKTKNKLTQMSPEQLREFVASLEGKEE